MLFFSDILLYRKITYKECVYLCLTHLRDEDWDEEGPIVFPYYLYIPIKRIPPYKYKQMFASGNPVVTHSVVSTPFSIGGCM